jgi:transposase
MQGKKQYQETLFVSFQLSEHVPEDNFYRKLKEVIGFSFLYKTTAAYYGTEGQKSIDPVVFMKLMLVGYLENLNSDRRIINTAQMRLDILYFLGYNIDEELPWHSTLSRTRQLYGAEVFREMFQSVLKQCIGRGMVSGKRQALDSALVKANASLDSMVEREVLQDVADFAIELDQNAEEVKKVPVVNLPQKAYPKGLAPKKNPGNQTHYSPSDPDAKMSVKPGKATAMNYLGQVSVDMASHVITHIQAFTADKRDSQCLPEVINNVVENLEENGLSVEEVVADTAFSSGEALKSLEENKITGYIPNRPQFVYERPGFVYHEEGDYYSCPGNKKLLYKGTYEIQPGIYNKEYRISKKLCDVCPLKSKCPVLKKNGALIRETLDKQYYQRMHERMQTKRAGRLMKERQSTVEPVIGTLINYLGMKKVNTKGLKQANKCMLLSATAYNIKKLLKHTSLLVQTKAVEMNKTLKTSVKSLLIHLKIFLQLNNKLYNHIPL